MGKAKQVNMIMLALIFISILIPITVNAQNEIDWGTYDWDSSNADEFALFGVGLGLTICVIMLLGFVVWILILIWVYKDAKKRGGNELLWLIVVFFTGLIGLIIWLVIRPPIGGKQNILGDSSASDRRCPNCGRNIPTDARVCPYCGKNFEEHLK